MFRHLSRRIVMISLLTITICTLVIGIFSYQWAKRTVQSEFIEVSSNYFRNSNESLDQYLGYIEESAKVLLNSPEIASEIQQNKVSTELPGLLDDLSLGMNLKLLGISIYKTNGTIYSLSRMSNMPSLDKLKEDPNIQRFIDNSAAKFNWTFRYKNLSTYGDSFRSNGTLSYLLKTFGDNGALLGVMIIDIDEDKLFDFFSNDNALFHESKLFLLRDDERVVYSLSDRDKEAAYPGDLAKIIKDPEGSLISAKGEQLMLFGSVLNSDTKIVMGLPLSNSFDNLHSLRKSIILFMLFSGSLAVLLSVLLKNSIIRPLNQLYKRIRMLR